MASPIMIDEQRPGRQLTISGSASAGEVVDISLDDLRDSANAEAVHDLLRDMSAECKHWTAVAAEHWAEGRMTEAKGLLDMAVKHFAKGGGDAVAQVHVHTMYAHLHFAMARSAPKVILPDARYDNAVAKTSPYTKDHYYREATMHLNSADRAAIQAINDGGMCEKPVALEFGKIMLNLAQGSFQLAEPAVTRLLTHSPDNVLALMAQARLQFVRRAPDQALATYRKLLTLAPDMKPDPRVGLGLCSWLMGDKALAVKSWDRALKRDPECLPALLLLGIADLNTSKDASIPEEERFIAGTKAVAILQRVFTQNNKMAAAALALVGVASARGNVAQASKLAERAIQYSDTRRHTVLANTERGRLSFVAGDLDEAGRYFNNLKEGEDQAVNIMRDLTLVQVVIQNGNYREALNQIEQMGRRIQGKGPLEYSVIHASLLAYPHPGMGPSEITKNRVAARTMLTDLHTLVLNASTPTEKAKLRAVADDVDLFVDIAKLWQDESLEKTVSAYQTAVGSAVAEANEDVKVDLKAMRMSSNLGALYQLQGSVEEAQDMYQEALSKLAASEDDSADAIKTTLAYNLGRAYEEDGNEAAAGRWYRDVLKQHPEHLESKVRLAAIAQGAGRAMEAHNLLKEALQSDQSNLDVRSFYSYFLISIGSYKDALTFTLQTFMKFDKNDLFTFCVLGWLHFNAGREAKSEAEIKDRQKQYFKAAEAYERALHIDPKCAFAAQGLAIALAEDVLVPKTPANAPPVSAADEAKAKTRAANQALGIFTRIKDSIVSGAVNVNIGHCLFARGEEERAIEAYGQASSAFNHRNVSVLLYLARAWYSFANRESNFSAMTQALGYCQKAMHLQPTDRAILYNIAMIQQKAAEMLLNLDAPKRTLEELQVALAHAEEAINIFRALADDQTRPLPYDTELAGQRAKYGEGLLRKAPDQLHRQEIYESQAKARVDEARAARAAEQAKIEAREAERRSEIERKAAELAEARAKAREQAREWQEELQRQQVEEENQKAQRAEKRKRTAEDGEGGERRKRKSGGRQKKQGSQSEESGVSAGEEEEAEMSGDGRNRRSRSRSKTKKTKKPRKKRVVEDPDGDDAQAEPAPKKKNSRFMLSVAELTDTDSEGDDAAADPSAAAGEASETEAAPTPAAVSPAAEASPAAEEMDED